MSRLKSILVSNSIYMLICTWCIVLMLFVNLGPLIGCPGRDSAAFIYVAQAMRDGLLPYADVFDHKGPLLYVFDWIGLSLGGGVLGIWLLETALLCIVSCYAAVEIKRYYGRISALLFVVVNSAWLIMTSGDDNLTEFWAVYFIVPIMVAILKITKNAAKSIDDFCVGVCSAALLLLRPNMATTGIVYCSYVFIEFVFRRDVRDFVLRTVRVVFGMALLLLPVIVWLVWTGILDDCWNSYILFNVQYLAGIGYGRGVDSWFFKSLAILLLVGVIGCGCVRDDCKSFLWAFNSCVATWCIIAIRPIYGHYFAVLSAPIAMALVVGTCRNRFRIPMRVVLCAMLLLGAHALACCTVFQWIHLPVAKEYVRKRVWPEKMNTILRNQSRQYDELEVFRPLIADRNSVLSLCQDSWVYWRLGVRASTKYFYQSPISGINADIHNSVYDTIMNGRERYLVRRKGDMSRFPRDNGFPYILLKNAPYSLAAETKGYELWERN